MSIYRVCSIGLNYELEFPISRSWKESYDKNIYIFVGVPSCV